MRQVFLQQPGARGPRLATLYQPEEVWEDGYPVAMGFPAVRPLHIFWSHYYGASAEVTWSAAALPLLLDDIAAMLPQCAALPHVQAFLRDLAGYCRRAQQQQLELHVIAD